MKAGLSIRNQAAVIEEVVIGNDVWVGAGAKILKGSHIGDGAVIGTNAVVTGDIPPNAIAVGIPARVIKYRK
jgi:acetyltransferase-like isoleucine patch superfamily enzyme